MIIKQLSVFLENKTGRLNEVTDCLGSADINLTALSIADTSEFGILRMIVSDPDKALKTLKKEGFAVSLTEVVCLQSPNTPGSLAKALDILSGEGVFIEYLYAFSNGNNAANVVLKPGDIQKCINILQKNKMKLLKEDELYQL